jgi:alkylated DNA nucleotide flippase Atl1
MRKTRMLDEVARVLDSGWSGTYGQLTAKVGSNPKADRGVATCVKAYPDLHRDWPHERVFSGRTGRPANEQEVSKRKHMA